MAANNDTKRFAVTVKMKSANTCTILIHQQGIASAQYVKQWVLKFRLYTPPSPTLPPKKMHCFQFLLGRL